MAQSKGRKRVHSLRTVNLCCRTQGGGKSVGLLARWRADALLKRHLGQSLHAHPRLRALLLLHRRKPSCLHESHTVSFPPHSIPYPNCRRRHILQYVTYRVKKGGGSGGWRCLLRCLALLVGNSYNNRLFQKDHPSVLASIIYQGSRQADT